MIASVSKKKCPVCQHEMDAKQYAALMLQRATARTYKRSCDCGECKKCKHREYVREKRRGK